MGLLNNKVAVVTGGSRGIGKAIVLRLAQEGAHVVFNYTKDKKNAKRTVDEAGEFRTTIQGIKLSVTDGDEVKNMAKRTIDQLGRIDILVNNAGINHDALFAMMRESDWDRVIDVNLKGLFHCCKAVLNGMIAQKGGKIINMTSITGLIGQEGQTNYSASKGAIISFTKTLAREVAKYGICVNAIAPGLINTQMAKKIPKNKLEQSIQSIPLQRLGEPVEVADATVFLASGMADFITGSILNVSGGQVM
ncbi:MAG: 3-oxoacyl-ACP reductase family protein [Desulfobacteraceae bacterium]|jgi:3-oxoacyl-[acyl-carrier protein] reductase